jgi:hypothetical protein
LDGGLNRLLLNHPKSAIFALLAMLVGAAFAFVAAAQKKHRRRFVISGFLVFFLGLFLLSFIEARSIGANERPAISPMAKVSADGSALEGKVTAGGVKSDEWVYLVISGVNPRLFC